MLIDERICTSTNDFTNDFINVLTNEFKDWFLCKKRIEECNYELIYDERIYKMIL